MSDAIDFLERMGQDALLRYAPKDEIAFALTDAQVELPQRSAILAGDPEPLQALLGRGPLYAILMSSIGEA